MVGVVRLFWDKQKITKINFQSEVSGAISITILLLCLLRLLLFQLFMCTWIFSIQPYLNPFRRYVPPYVTLCVICLEPTQFPPCSCVKLWSSQYRLHALYNTVYSCTVYFVLCTVVQSFSSEQEMDSPMCHMSTFWSEDLVSCQFLSDLRTSNILNICKQKLNKNKTIITTFYCNQNIS